MAQVRRYTKDYLVYLRGKIREHIDAGGELKDALRRPVALYPPRLRTARDQKRRRLRSDGVSNASLFRLACTIDGQASRTRS